MDLQNVFIFFFVSFLAAAVIVRYIRKRHKAKQLLLTPVRINKTKVPLNPLLENRYIGIALSNTFDRTFARIHDADTRTELIDCIQDSCKFSAGQSISVLDLSKTLLDESKDRSGTDVSFWLKELSTTTVEQLATMVDEVDSALIQSEDLSRLITFCLRNVTLAELEYA